MKKALLVLSILGLALGAPSVAAAGNPAAKSAYAAGCGASSATGFNANGTAWVIAGVSNPHCRVQVHMRYLPIGAGAYTGLSTAFGAPLIGATTPKRVDRVHGTTEICVTVRIPGWNVQSSGCERHNPLWWMV